MAFTSNSSQFSISSILNVSGPATFTNTVTIQSQLIANGTNGTAGQLLLSAGSGNTYWGSANSITSSFINWQINGSPTITASGGDTLNIISGNNIVIVGSNSAVKSLTINANIPYANSTANGVVILVDSVSNTSATIAAAANSVKNAYDRAIDANTRASSAQTAAESAYSNAIAYSGNAALAYANAIATASADATTKAGTAYSNASADATTKAGTAYSNAISDAATDATTKAGTAYSNAIAYSGNAALAYANAVAYAASNTYVNDTFAAKASPTFTGTAQFSNAIITNSGATHNVLGSGSGSRTIDLSLGNYVSATVAGSTTWTFSNPFTSPTAVVFILELTNGGSAVLTWPAAVKWPNGTAPTLTASGIDLLSFITDDGGTTWRGVLSIRNSY